MTIKEAIKKANEIKPNAFTRSVKFDWIKAFEGKVALDVFLMTIDQVDELRYTYPDDLDTELMIRDPHDDLYVLWLMVKIDEANGEYTKQNNTTQSFDWQYKNFVRWFARKYEPAQGYDFGRRRHESV